MPLQPHNDLPHDLPRVPHALPRPGAPDVQALALRLQHLARAQAPLPPLLRGKNIGLLRDAAGTADPGPLLHAATALGAQVATVRWSLSDAGRPGELLHTGRMLGRLYDAVVCQGMPAALVRQIAQAAGVPVYDDIVCDAHTGPGNGPGDEKENDEQTQGEHPRFVLLALLVDALA